MDDLTDLNHCPLCGGAEGYFLGDGETYRWWGVACKACGESVTECRANPHMTINREPPPARHPNADAAWQEATKHYAEVCGNVDRLIARVAALEAERDVLKATLHDELDENLRLRALGGARPDEGMTAYIERVIAERDALSVRVTRMEAEREALFAAKRDAQAERDALLTACRRAVLALAHTTDPIYAAAYRDLDAAIDAAREADR